MLEVTFLSVPPKISVSQFSSRSQVLSRGSLAPTLPLIPQPLHPPLLSNPAALPLLCILHLLDYSAVSKHSARVAPSIVRSVTGLYFLLNFWVDASCRVHNLASLNISVPEFVFKRQFNYSTVALVFIHLSFKIARRCMTRVYSIRQVILYMPAVYVSVRLASPTSFCTL